MFCSGRHARTGIEYRIPKKTKKKKNIKRDKSRKVNATCSSMNQRISRGWIVEHIVQTSN